MAPALTFIVRCQVCTTKRSRARTSANTNTSYQLSGSPSQRITLRTAGIQPPSTPSSRRLISAVSPSSANACSGREVRLRPLGRIGMVSRLSRVPTKVVQGQRPPLSLGRARKPAAAPSRTCASSGSPSRSRRSASRSASAIATSASGNPKYGLPSAGYAGSVRLSSRSMPLSLHTVSWPCASSRCS